MDIIKLKNACKEFGKDDSKVKALDNVNITVKKGEMVAIVGPSGSGKSTLLNIIGCLDKLDSGEYILNDKKVSDFKSSKLSYIRNNEFGFVVQYFALIDDYTVYENVKVPLKYSKKGFKKNKNRIIDLLIELDIEAKKDNYPCELSGGQNQRVAIARAIINDPDIILADEPTGALDSKTGNQVIHMLKKLNSKGKTIIIVTHDSSVAERCDRTIKIQDGKVL